MIGLSHYRECGLYDATLMTGKLVSRSKQIDSELSDFRNQLNELMQSFNTVMWPDVRWQSIWHWCKVIWCPQNDPGGNKTRKMAIKVHNKRTTGSIHIIAAYNGEIQGWFDVVYEVQLLYKVLSLCFPWSLYFPCSLWYAPKGYFWDPRCHCVFYDIAMMINYCFCQFCLCVQLNYAVESGVFFLRAFGIFFTWLKPNIAIKSPQNVFICQSWYKFIKSIHPAWVLRTTIYVCYKKVWKPSSIGEYWECRSYAHNRYVWTVSIYQVLEISLILH